MIFGILVNVLSIVLNTIAFFGTSSRGRWISFGFAMLGLISTVVLITLRIVRESP